MTRKQRRLILIGGSLSVLALAVTLALSALRQSIVFFNSPNDIAEQHVAAKTSARLGGLVKAGSIKRGDDLRVDFAVTDSKSDIAITYQGIVPDLFRKRQRVVVESVVQSRDAFKADIMFAKQDERYMPREVTDALKKAGRWQEGATK